MTRLAAVDIGTNSVLLLIVEHRDGGLHRLHETFIITRLGQGVDRSGRLAPEAVARTLEALGRFAVTMEEYGVSRRAAVGTAVLRDAGSGEAREAMEEVLGCTLEVISGRREAELVAAGVRGDLGALEAGTLLFDVGGGSTELVLAGEDGDLELVSLELGSVRMTERFGLTDPPGAEELLALRAAARRQLDALPTPPWRARRLVGLAGTVTTLATLQLELERYDSERVNGLRLSRMQIEDRLADLASIPLSQRQQVAGLSAGRADIIVAGVCIVAEIMARFNVDELQVSDRGVRWGLLWEMT